MSIHQIRSKFLQGSYGFHIHFGRSKRNMRLVILISRKTLAGSQRRKILQQQGSIYQSSRVVLVATITKKSYKKARNKQELKDSNSHTQFWRLLCCHYTKSLRWMSILLNHRYHIKNLYFCQPTVP
jgi:hypothetical protein